MAFGLLAYGPYNYARACASGMHAYCMLQPAHRNTLSRSVLCRSSRSWIPPPNWAARVMAQLALTVIMGLIFLKTEGEPTWKSDCLVPFSIIISLSLSLSHRLLNETNERRFDSRQVIASPRKWVKKRRTNKTSHYDFPKPIWSKKKKQKKILNPGPEITIKEEAEE